MPVSAAPLRLDPRKTALVMIDLQNGILGMALAPHASAQVVAGAVALGRAIKAGGGTVVLVNVAFAADGRDRLSQPVDTAMSVPVGGLPPGWSDFAPEVVAIGADVVVTKRHWGAFHGTELDLQLRRRGVDTIVLGGIATNFGVESTAREAWQHGYAVVLAEDACSSVSEAAHRFSIETIMPRLSRVRRTAEILEALG